MDEEGLVAVEQAWNTAVGIVIAKVRDPRLMREIMNEMRHMEEQQRPASE